MAAFGLGVRNAYTSASQAAGQAWAQLAARWLRRHVDLRQARRSIARGGGPALLLTAGAPAGTRQAAQRAHDALRSQVIPTPNTSALIHALEGASEPFGGKRAAVIGIGPGAARELGLLISATGRRSVAEGFAVENAPAAPAGRLVATADGDLWGQLDAAVRWAARHLEAGSAEVVAVMLRPPMTGSWEEEEQFDIPRLIGSVLGDLKPVWLTMAEPVDPSAWPEEVAMTLPLPARAFLRAVRGSTAPPSLGTVHRAGRRELRLSSFDACRIVLGFVDRLLPPPARQNPGQAAQRYGAEITLALREPGAAADVFVGLDATLSGQLQSFLDAAGVTYAAPQPDGASLMLPLSIVPNRLIAWRAVRPAALTSATRVRNLEPVPAIRWLTEACETRDDSVAAAVLADHGRAWIESRNLEQTLPLLRRATETFPRESSAYLWAHYLLALDSALRRNAPEEGWFDDQMCQQAEGSELGLLYQVERMEFRRLRGELDAACTDLNTLYPQLSAPIDATTNGGLYAQATARYVAANTLRRGGRYDRARELIDAAVSAYKPGIPAHRIELTHGTYAIAVCDSLRGTATVRPAGADDGQAVFARSLVTLANSHASWFVEDYERAIEFAEQARTGFSTIGYQRYADRSRDLARLIAEWARRCGRPSAAAIEPDPRVNALLAVPPAGTTDQLAAERPSRALSLIYFATAFGQGPNTSRAIALPPYIAVTDQNTFVLRTPAPASSYQDAERQLRAILGVSADTRLPLAAD